MSLKALERATSLKELASAASRAASTLEQDINEIVKTAAINLSFELIYRTPVDTTKATSNWTVGIGFPEFIDRPAYFYGHDGITAAMSRSSAYAAAKSAVGTRKRTGFPIYISNNVNYIVELNEGKSPQQPMSHWIEAIVDRAKVELTIELRKYING